MRLPLAPFVLSLSLVACASAPGRPAGPRPASSAAASASVSVGTNAPLAPFRNPGGMWMPSQLLEQQDTLRGLGLTLDPRKLADPTQHPLDAIVSLGGCSASFVSDSGLLVTNHHCVTGALQYNSTPEENLLRDGYLAKAREAEKWAGPTQRVFVTLGFRDVTDDVLDALPTMKDDMVRGEALERRTKQLTNACEKGRPGVRCTIARYFDGAMFLEVQQLEIRDVRLVYVPAASIGNFGGEVDNWRWPRHTGDFAFLRAYVNQHGQPADHAAGNVPYKPQHHLELADEPLAAGDFVMVAGYPGRTNRLKTAEEVQDAIAFTYPRSIRHAEAQIALLEGITKSQPALAIKAASQLRRLHNRLTNHRGTLEGLTKGGLAEQRAEEEQKLRAAIAESPALTAKAGTVLERMAETRRKQLISREPDSAFQAILDSAKMLGSAMTIVRMAEERPKADEERDPSFQQRNWQRLSQAEATAQKAYDPLLDKATLRLALSWAMALPEADRPGAVEIITRKKSPSPEEIDRAIDALYKGTKLGDEKVRIGHLETASAKELSKSKDTFIVLARKLRPLQRALELDGKAYDGAMSVLRPQYIDALRTFRNGVLAPDANGTLRISYGTVRALESGGAAFTLLPEIAKKTTGRDPFDTPTRLLEAAARKDETYGDAALGEVPVDFLADLDITGGNSGSATLNRKGQLVGLAFDGTYESVASDWMFMRNVTRSIHVDLRYILWVMDRVDGAENILTELGRRKPPAPVEP